MFKKQFLYSLISLLLMSGYHSLNGALHPLRFAQAPQANASAAHYSAREKTFADTSNTRDIKAVNLLMSITLLEQIKAKSAATQLQKAEQGAQAALAAVDPDDLESDESDSDTEPVLKKAKTEKLQGDQPQAKLAADIPPKRRLANPTQLSHQKSSNKKVLAAAAASASIERPKRIPKPKKPYVAQASSKEDIENQSPNESDADYEDSGDSTGDDTSDCDDDKPSKSKKKASNGKKNNFANHQPRPCTWPQCKKILSSKIALDGHLRTHTGEKPFKCALCDNKWALRGNTVRHYIRDHVVRKGSNPGKATRCGTCIKLKNKSDELQKHLRDAGSSHIIDTRNA